MTWADQRLNYLVLFVNTGLHNYPDLSRACLNKLLKGPPCMHAVPTTEFSPYDGASRIVYACSLVS